MTAKTTFDRFLGGRVVVEQPLKGYRSGADPVFLAAAAPAEPKDRILELGTGAGTALLCLAARIQVAHLTGVERDPALAALARTNAKRAEVPLRVIEADLMHLPAGIRAETFDHVLTNPPFFDRSRGSKASEDGREAGRGADTPLAGWMDVAIRRAAPKGRLTVIWPAARLPDMLACFDSRVGAINIKPLSPRQGRAAELVLISAIKGSRTPARLLPPLVLHDGARHEKDGDSYTAEAAGILRDAAALTWL